MGASGSAASTAAAEARPQGRRPVGAGHLNATLAARARPTSSSRDQLLPLLPLPRPPPARRGPATGWRGQRGSRRRSRRGEGGGGPGPRGGGGGTTLAFALLAAASTAGRGAGRWGRPIPGSWAWPRWGWTSGTWRSSPAPGPCGPEVAATLLDGLDVVLVRPPGPVRPGAARRLAARARQRRAVLVVLAGPRGWPDGAGVRLAVDAGSWRGVGDGHGHLQGRRAVVVATGRRSAARPVQIDLWLPTPSGRIEPGAGPGDRPPG